MPLPWLLLKEELIPMGFDIISVVGLGYIGLPTAAAFASHRKQVIGVDVNAEVVKVINAGDIHIAEPGLDITVHLAVMEGWLRATERPEPADAFVIAVPTPLKAGRKPDISCIEAAARAIAPVLNRGNLVVLESTSPVGTTETMANWLAAARPDLSFPHQVGEQADVNIAHTPETVLPGQVMRELVENHRLIGGMTQRCGQRTVELYKTFVAGDCILTDVRTAEMCKLAENAFRDINIAYANELSLICDQLNIDVWKLIRLANRHPRVNILQPGPGVGGHCIAVDPWFIVDACPEYSPLIQAARRVNDHKPAWVLNKIRTAVDSWRAASGKNPTVAGLGLAFKPNVDDLRESPALQIAQTLNQWFQEDRSGELFGELLLVEPYIRNLPPSFEGARLTNTQEALEQADILVVLVDHEEFKAIVQEQVQGKVLVDTRGLWM